MPKGYHDPVGFAEDDLARYREITFKNMVHFYHDELKRLLNGELATNVLTKGDRRVLRRLGILNLTGTGNTGRRLVVAPKTSKLLQKLVFLYPQNPEKAS